MSALLTTRFVDGVLWVTMTRAEKRNALSDALIAAIGDTFDEWRKFDGAALVVLTGAGDKAFASGGDLKELEAMRDEQEALAFAKRTRAVFDKIRAFPVPVVALLNGDALGGGAELCMACDLRIALAHARMGFLQAKLNIATAWGGGTDLFSLVGSARAIRILATAQIYNASEALAAGLVDAVAPSDGAEAFVSEYLAQMKRPPQVMRAIKSLAVMRRFGGTPGERALQESQYFAAAWTHDDHWAAVAEMMSAKK